jgi:hypothetical protein
MLLAPLTPIVAQTSGVLLGVRRSVPIDGPDSLHYETFWIVRSSKAPLRATLPELLVPRADGFWRAGVAATCVRDADWRIDRVWLVKADTAPVIVEGCPTTTRTEMRADVDTAEQAALDTVVCAIESIEINFVTGDVVGTEHVTGQTEDCEPRGGRYDVTHVVRRWNSDSSLAFARVAGPRADVAFRSAAHAAVRSASAECAEFAGDTAYVDWPTGTMDYYHVARDRGHWRAYAFGHVYGTDCSFEAPVSLSLPRAFTGHDALRPPWSAIARRAPGLLDAITSPNGDMVVAFTGDSLFAFESNGATIGTRLLAMPFRREHIVMAQWAVGRNAARWDREIARLRPLLRPARVIPEKR